MDESIERLMNASDEFSNGYKPMDEDVLNYLSTLSPHQQKLLDDFVSFSDHAVAMPVPVPLAAPNFAYGNSVGANSYFGRPMSVYEPFIPDAEFSSLPPDLVSSNDPNMTLSLENLAQKYSWEAEDTEYIETLNELRDNFEHQSATHYAATDHYKVPSVMHTIADVHYNDGDVDEKPVEHIYATVQKPKKQLENQMTASDRSASDPPREKFPKIMTESCYGELNHPTDLLWNCYEQDLVQSMENIIEDGNHQLISSLMTDSSIIDGVSSVNSSIYEQIPSMTSSIELQATMTRSSNQRKIVKWWDDHAEESALDLNGMAEEGELENLFHS